MPLFNPCSPCCAFNLVDVELFNFYTNAGLPFRYYTNLNPSQNINYSTNLMFIKYSLIYSDLYGFGNSGGAGLAQIRDWFETGGKRLVITSTSNGGPTPPSPHVIINAVNDFINSLGSGIIIDPGSLLLGSAGSCGVASFNSHYLTQGLSTYNHGSYYLNCICNLLFQSTSAPFNHSSCGSGSMLTNYLGGNSMAVEQVNTIGGISEIVSFTDYMGFALSPTNNVGDACWDQVSPPPYLPECGGSFGNEGCYWATPQFLLNLATVGIE